MALKSKIRAVNLLLHGWGYEEGRWVYLPLWDPALLYNAFRYLVASAAVADAAKLVSNKALAGKLHDVAGSLVSQANAGFTKSWEDGDPICPPLPWPWLPTHPPVPGPIPGPLDQFIQRLSPVAKNAVVGNLVAIIGETLGDKAVIAIGNEIMAAR